MAGGRGSSNCKTTIPRLYKLPIEWRFPSFMNHQLMHKGVDHMESFVFIPGRPTSCRSDLKEHFKRMSKCF